MIRGKFLAIELILRRWAESILGVAQILRGRAEHILGKWPSEPLEAEPV